LARQPRSAASSKSLQKAIRILLHLGENGPDMSISQFASALRLNKTTVHRLLRALQEFHLVERNPHNEKYRLGLKFHALGARSVLWRSLPYDARPFLVELSRRSGATAILAIPGDFIPAHCTAFGRAILSWLPETESAPSSVAGAYIVTLQTPLTTHAISATLSKCTAVRVAPSSMGR
jgi:DNA-binding IclR family transcriptional regulator